ncbi:MAG: class I SAM-dependent methyltransferase [Eubacteriales bacterium]
MKKIIQQVTDDRTMKKIVLSRPSDKTIIKTTATLFEKNGQLFVQSETLHTDGKATHVNISAPEAADYIERIFKEDFGQADIITTGGSCTVMISSSGRLHIKNNIKPSAAIAVKSHDSEKRYILAEESAYPFLYLLGISDEKGRVFDKKRAKYRQINRFLELVGDIYDKLPQGKLTVCDLCCGKSYLTFAVYWYLTEKMSREVDMYGVDLKSDVIAGCVDYALKLGYGGMHFIEGDAYNFTPPARPVLVISLHACDTATDIVLAGAVKQGADVILSTPCCHHELNSQIDCPTLAFITGYSILQQKLCDAATDALRALRLRIEGYEVTAIELIDPEETPKNVLLRAVRNKSSLSEEQQESLIAEYRTACSLLGADPMLDKLLKRK